MKGGFLNPQYWPTCIVKLKHPIVDEANPMMEFHPANSGSLNVDKTKIQKRNIPKHPTGSGVEGRQYEKMREKYNKGQYFAPLQNGEIAVVPDDVLVKSTGLGSDTHVDTFFRLAREMCLRMQHNKTLGLGIHTRRHWFNKGYEGGGGAPFAGPTIQSAPSGSLKRKGKSNGRGRKKARKVATPEVLGGGSASGGVFDFTDES